MAFSKAFATIFVAALIGVSGLATAQTPPATTPPATTPAPTVAVRGTITAFDGKVLQVKDRTGKDIAIEVPDTVNVTVAKAFTLADIKPGMVLAVTSLKRADGTVVALDVRPLPPTANLSSTAYDLAPGSQMNNANLEAMVAGTTGTELTLNFKTGTVKATITPETTMSQSAPGARTDLKPGETVFARVRMDGDKTVAAGVQVSKDGVKPGQ